MFTFLSTTKYSFEGKMPEENVDIFLHRHWFTLIGKFFIVFILAILPIILGSTVEFLLKSINQSNLGIVVINLYYMALWSATIYILTMYLLDSWIVTDKRIINNTQQGFFNRTISETQLSRIQDVSVKISGLIPTVLHFGNVEIQTAGTTEKFVFEQIPNPEQVKDEIMNLVTVAKNNLPH